MYDPRFFLRPSTIFPTTGRFPSWRNARHREIRRLLRPSAIETMPHAIVSHEKKKKRKEKCSPRVAVHDASLSHGGKMRNDDDLIQGKMELPISDPGPSQVFISLTAHDQNMECECVCAVLGTNFKKSPATFFLISFLFSIIVAWCCANCRPRLSRHMFQDGKGFRKRRGWTTRLRTKRASHGLYPHPVHSVPGFRRIRARRHRRSPSTSPAESLTRRAPSSRTPTKGLGPRPV